MEILQLHQPIRDLKTFSHEGIDTLQPHEETQDEVDFLLVNDQETRDHEIQTLASRIRLLEQALQEARTEAFQAGYEEGKETATREARRQYTTLTAEFAQNLKGLHRQFTELLERMEQPLLELSLGAAERILESEFQEDAKAKQVLQSRIQRFLNEAVNQTRATVHINPSQLNWIMGTDVIPTLNVPQGEQMRLVADEAIRPGECILETEDYIIDGTIQSQLEMLQEELNGRHGTTPPQI